MAKNNKASDILYRTANDCIKEFNGLCEIDSTSWAEDQRARFNIWATNLGVFADGHASADYRLEESPSIRQVIAQLLAALKANICYVTKLLRHSTGTLEEISEEKEDQASVSSASSGSSLGVPSLESEEEGNLSGSTALLRSRVDIGDGITRLIAISKSIRQSGMKNRDQRADKFIDEDEEGNNITALFAVYITHVVNDKFPNISDKIRQRIINSISRRRNRLSYRRKHQKKLSTKRPEQETLVPASTRQDHMASSSLSTKQVGDASMLSTTSATRTHINQATLRRGLGKGSSVISGVSLKARTLDVPPAPRLLANSDVFECPYCNVLCPARDRNIERWRRHVMKDLMPYICIFDNCTSSEAFFQTYEDWVLHMQQQHTDVQWTCHAPKHGEKIFLQQDLYEEHMHKEHAGTFAISELPILSRMSLRSEVPIFSYCPICNSSPDDFKELIDTSLSTSQKLQEHIAGHLEYLSLMSLKWLDDQESVDPIYGSEGTRSINNDVLGDEDVFPDSYVDLDWKGVLPDAHIPSDDQAWTTQYNLSKGDEASEQEEWEFCRKTLTDYEGHSDDLKLRSFVQRFEDNQEKCAIDQKLTVNQPPTRVPVERSNRLTRSSKDNRSWSEWYWNAADQCYERYIYDSKGVRNYEQRTDDRTPKDRETDLPPLDTIAESSSQKNYQPENFKDISHPVGDITQGVADTSLNTNSSNSPATGREDGTRTGYSNYPNTSGSTTRTIRTQNPATNVDPLDKDFTVHPSWEFKFGKVFKVLWSEPTGNAGTQITGRHVVSRHGQATYHSIRRFVIIDDRNPGHSLCLPILTYGGKGVQKSGAHAEDHAVIYTSKEIGPLLMPGENITKASIRMKPNGAREKLDKASRLNYAKLYTVEHNVKVKFIGEVVREHQQQLVADYNDAHPPVGNRPWAESVPESTFEESQGEDPKYTGYQPSGTFYPLSSTSAQPEVAYTGASMSNEQSGSSYQYANVPSYQQGGSTGYGYYKAPEEDDDRYGYVRKDY